MATSVTAEWDVPLMVVKGFTSKAFANSAAEAIDAVGKPAFLYYFGDWDPGGLWVWKDVQAKIRRYAPKADVTFEGVAVTQQQIADYKLPTRPTKRKGNSHAKNFAGNSVEVDALPPVTLQDPVRNCIERYIDKRQLAITKVAEASEREALGVRQSIAMRAFTLVLFGTDSAGHKPFRGAGFGLSGNAAGSASHWRLPLGLLASPQRRRPRRPSRIALRVRYSRCRWHREG